MSNGTSDTSVIDKPDPTHFDVVVVGTAACVACDEPTPPEMIAQFKAGGYSESLRRVDWQGENPAEPAAAAAFSFDALHDEIQNKAVCDRIEAKFRYEVNDKDLAAVVKKMKADRQDQVEPSKEAVEAWTELCEASSDGKVWLRCNNW
ncbi:MAG: hypothetical protein ACI9B8_002532 [Sulfitobacter sp.]|jgi:hypothetical protein